MIKQSLCIALLTWSQYSLSFTYSLEQLHEMVDSGDPPKALSPKLYENSAEYVDFERCRTNYLADLARLKSYPQRIERDSLGVFLASVWTEESVYRFSCIDTYGDIIAESYETHYKE